MDAELPSNVIVNNPPGATAGGVDGGGAAPAAPPPAPAAPAPPPAPVMSPMNNDSQGNSGGGIGAFFREMDWVQASILILVFASGFFMIYYYRTAVIRSKSTITDQQLQINQMKSDLEKVKDDIAAKEAAETSPANNGFQGIL